MSHSTNDPYNDMDRDQIKKMSEQTREDLNAEIGRAHV